MPAKMTMTRIHPLTDAHQAVDKVKAAHGEPGEIIIICTTPGSGQEAERRIRLVLGLDPATF